MGLIRTTYTSDNKDKNEFYMNRDSYVEDINAKKVLQVASVIDAANSTSATLAGSGTYTGSWTDVSLYDSIVVAAKTDQNGYFQVEYSPDATNIDSTLKRYYRTSQIEAPHRFTNTRKYARVSFINSSTVTQSYFRMQTMLGDKANLNAPMDSTLAQDFDATVVRPTDFHTEVALGRRQGATTWNKFGYNEDIDTTTDPEIIASWGGTFQHLTSGETLTIVSSSTDDDLVGTGAQRIIVYGVDENWDEVIEVVEMDGTTNVVTTSQWIGINRVSIYKAGSGLSNAGTITITATSSGYTLGQMPTGEGTSQQCVLYVPRDHQFLAEWLSFNAIKTGGGSSPEITFKGLVYSDVATAEFEVYRASLDVADSTQLTVSPPIPFVIGEKSILWFTAETDTNNTVVKGRFSGEMVRNVDA